VLGIVDERADQIGRQQIRRELNTSERRMDGPGESSHRHRLGQARDALHQHVAIREQPNEQPLHHIALPHDDAADFVQQPSNEGALLLDLLLNRFDIAMHRWLSPFFAAFGPTCSSHPTGSGSSSGEFGGLRAGSYRGGHHLAATSL
jgi:hypothetical protein